MIEKQLINEAVAITDTLKGSTVEKIVVLKAAVGILEAMLYGETMAAAITSSFRGRKP